MSPWLSAIGALDRRLSSAKFSLAHYRALGMVHELKAVEDEELAIFITHNENPELAKPIIEDLLNQHMLERDEETEQIILTEPGANIIDEIYRLVHSRLTLPLFVAPKR